MILLIDLQALQAPIRHHGVGRYVLSITKQLLKSYSQEHTIFLLLNHSLESRWAKALIGDLADPAHWVYWRPAEAIDLGLQEIMLADFIDQLNVDVYIQTHSFTREGVSAVPRNTYSCAILYDLIPLANPDSYLIDTFYTNKVNQLKEYNHLLSISDYSKLEAQNLLNLNARNITSIGTALPLLDQQTNSQAELEVPEHYFLYAPSGFDPRKNLERLFEAYAQFDVLIRSKYPLLLVGKAHQAVQEELEELCEKYSISGNVQFLGYVDDVHLNLLYQKATCFVYPTLHEGFGLPALEAMHWGCATIGSNRTSVPEVIGMDEALFNPEDIQSIYKSMQRVIDEPGFHAELKAHALKQAIKFNWGTIVERTLECLESRMSGFVPSKIPHENTLYKEIRNQGFNESQLMCIANSIAMNDATLRRISSYKYRHELQNWQVEGPFDSSYSLALLNRETAITLEQLSETARLHSTDGPGDFEPDPSYLKQHPEIKRLHEVNFADDVKIQTRNLYPPRVSDMTANIRLLHHYAWEETGFPYDWTQNFNQYLNGISCLSSHVEKILVDQGVTCPLITSGCGVDHWFRIKSEPGFKLNADVFNFLHVSSCFPRKGVDLLLDAYGQAFTKNDRVNLVIKTFANPHNTVKTQIKEKQLNPNYPSIQVIEEDLSDAQLKALYEECQCLVAPSKAEGFGLPLAEAMLSGLPVITTGWGGQTDFCNQETAWLIDYDFEPAQSHLPVFDSVWAIPKLSSLIQKLKEVYHAEPATLKLKNEAAIKLLKQEFSWSNVCRRHVEMTQNLSFDDPHPTIALMSTWGVKCGIATYSKALADSLDNSDLIILANEIDEPGQIQSNVFRSWNEQGFGNILHILKTQYVDTLVIQFNYMFYNYSALSKLIEHAQQLKITVVLELHSTQPPENHPDRHLKYLQKTLEACDAIWVHSVRDLNIMKGLGHVDNVVLFPHGIHPKPDALEKPIDLPDLKETFTLATYGFFLPHKGFVEMIEVVKKLRDKGHNVHLLMINAEYPVESSRETILQAQALAKSLEISEHVTFKTDFLADQDSLSYLNQADLVVFPYQETGEAASGAARYGITAQKPVAVTPLDIFTDIKEICHVLPGTSVDQLTQGLIDIISQIKEQDPNIVAKAHQQRAWYDVHLYPRIAQRMQQMLIALKRQKDKR